MTTALLIADLERDEGLGRRQRSPFVLDSTMDKGGENWRPVAGDDRYEVSDLGRIRRRSSGRILKPTGCYSRKGRPVSHYALNLGHSNRRRVHRLVLEAFVGPAPHGMMGCHNDGDPSNNRLSNLRWDTAKANQHDSVCHGTKVLPPVYRGDAHPGAKLTTTAVEAIRAEPLVNGVLGRLATRYGISTKTVWRIRHGLAWTACMGAAQ